MEKDCIALRTFCIFSMFCVSFFFASAADPGDGGGIGDGAGDGGGGGVAVAIEGGGVVRQPKQRWWLCWRQRSCRLCVGDVI